MEVRLIRAVVHPEPPSAGTWRCAKFYIEVEHLAYEKHVLVCFARDYPDAQAHYVRPLPNGRELWSCTVFRSPSRRLLGKWFPPMKFCIQYRVNGRTYWDNNGGWDYWLDNHDRIALGVGTNFALETVLSFEGHFYGWIAARTNWGQKREFRVIYSENNDWNSVRECLVYSPSSGRGARAGGSLYGFGSIELWYFEANIGHNADIYFAIACTVDGTTYWDNDHGENYRVDVHMPLDPFSLGYPILADI